MQKFFATPAPGVRVRKEDGSILAEAGEPVVRSAFWLRRERDGDVILKPVADEAAEAPTITPVKTKK